MKMTFLILLLSTFASFPQTGRVVGVIDGDTIEMLINEKIVEVMLSGIDAPEPNQAFGQEAREYLSNLIYGKFVELESEGLDRYGRTIGNLFTTDGVWVNRFLVINGMAWHYVQYSSNKDLASAELKAKKMKNDEEKVAF